MTRTGIDIDEAKVSHNEFGLWLGWTLATAAGMLAGFLPSLLLVNVLDLPLSRVIVPLLAGFLIGLAQWAVLRNFVVNSHDWILAAGTSWAVGYAVGLFLINSLSGTPLSGMIGFALFGAVIAIIQYPIFRREIPHLSYWIIANMLGWMAGFYLSQVSLNLFFSNVPAINPVASTSFVSVVTGLVAGAVTGLALIWIVRHPDIIKTSRN